MKRCLLFVVLLFSSSVFAVDEYSECPPPRDTMEDAVNCEQVEAAEQLKSCAKAPPASNAVQDRLNNLLSKTNLLNWLGYDGKVPGVKKDDLEKSIRAQFLDFAKKYDCIPRVIRSSENDEGRTGWSEVYPRGYSEDPKNLEQFKAAMTKTSAVKAKDEYFTEYNKNFKNNQICDPSSMDPGPHSMRDELYPPCAGNVTGYFKDNEWNMSNVNLNDPAGAALAQCIKDRKDKGAVIDRIKVSSSSSALNNSGDAARRFCKKGFLELSKARAENARDELLPQIFNSAGVTVEPGVISGAQIEPTGSNKDGTSGPCPYQLIDGKEVQKPEYSTLAGKKELDPYKYVKIQVMFKDSSKTVPGTRFALMPKYSCRHISFACE